jgi:hypothetical protein
MIVVHKIVITGHIVDWHLSLTQFFREHRENEGIRYCPVKDIPWYDHRTIIMGK